MLRDLTATTSGGRGILGTHLVGVLASELPSGFPLPGLLNNDVEADDPVGTLYCGTMTSWPSAGVLTVDEYGAFSFTGAPDGTYNATMLVKKYGPTSGLFLSEASNITFTIGSGGTVITTTPVAKAFSFSYNVLGSVVKSFAFSYNILGSYTPVTIDASRVSANRKVVFPGNIKTVRF